ncbi:MAG TPA: sulfotransferase domain-containing protein [Caulobacteraceae bacterium]|jgi:aryl sulfotransferase|nr:sulfotransferase domain-containing protein [Caulobacteraceae bacterium]
MTATDIAWPQKTRQLHNHHMDSTVWDRFKFRDDDVIVSTYGKSGTTWTQHIVGQLLYGGDPSIEISHISPWVDLRIMPPELLDILEAQTHRRVVKTHLPLDALVYSPKAKYLYVARDGRDVIFSMYNHHASANDMWYDRLNNTPGLVGPKIEPPDPDIRRYFRNWVEHDGQPFWSFWDNVRSWYAARNLPNLHMVHFARLKVDPEGEIKAIADFLDVDVDATVWPEILEHCTFAWMKAHAAQVSPLGGAIFNGGADSFIFKGVNGRWKDVLSPEESAMYEAKALEELGPECAHWLATGEMATSEPLAA